MKKILIRIWIILLVLFALICTFVLVCAFNPDITEKVTDILYSDGREDGAENTDSLLPDTEDSAQSGEVIKGGIYTDDPSDSAGYIPPNQSEISIPDNVAGRNGYRPIQEDARQIEEEEAKELERQIGVGNTGDDLSFDPVFYPYYAMLNERGKSLYRQIYANANDLNESFAPVVEIQVNELKDIFAAVYNDHPELFFVETAYNCKYRKNGQCVEIDLSFNKTARSLESSRAEFLSRAEEVMAGARGFSDNYNKEKYVHDALTGRISYNITAEMNQSAYSALVNGQTVCAGYARAFQYIMQQLGIPCYYCTGFAGENHAWNIVVLDDGCYNVDVTWDDTEEGSNYDYFNKSDADYADTHIRKELSVKLPPCNGQRYRNPEPDESAERMQEQNQKQEILTTLTDYYNDCYSQIVSTGLGSYTFTNVIEGEDLFEQWYDSYQSEACMAGYLENALQAIGADSYVIIYEAKELENGRYLITHEVVFE